jgi:uncharacterized protein (TIGR00369 family)
MDFTLEEARRVMGTVFPDFVKDLGITVESVAKDSGVHLRLPLDEKICREGNIVSGQVLAVLADTAMVYSIWVALGVQKPVSTVDLHVTYLRPASKSDVIAHSEVIRLGRSLAFARVSMRIEKSMTLVATAIGTFALPQ